MPLSNPQYAKFAIEGAEQFRQQNAALLVCYDTSSLFEILDAELRLTDLGDPSSVEDFKSAMERAFVTLVERGALSSILLIDPSAEATEQLNDMLRSVGYDLSEIDKSKPEAVAAQKAEAERQEVIHDWNTLPSQAFKTKWFGARRAIYDAAVLEGRI